jgi:uncharacterized protein (DUF58 family)
MLSKELLQKVRQIELSTRKAVDDVLSGQYRSHFKGQGVQFSEHRVYVPGDDVRHIDWKVSARTRDPLVKKFEEERELNVFLVIDVSQSEGFGSKDLLKSEVVAQVGGMLSYAAIHTGDRVGALFFAGAVEKIVPPKKGRQHVLRLIRDLLTFKPKSQGTHLREALEATDRMMKHRGIVFILSDFMAAGYETALRRLARRHDVVAMMIHDEREVELPELGYVLFRDPETGVERWVDSSSYSFQKWFKDEMTQRASLRDQIFKSNQIEVLKILTKEDFADAVVRFFRVRSRRRK